MGKLTLRRDGPGSWVLSDPATGHDLGGIAYVHAADGNHYRPWRNVDGERQGDGDGEAVPQLGMAVRAVTDAIARSGKPCLARPLLGVDRPAFDQRQSGCS